MSADVGIRDLEWFDCNARIGRWSAPRPEQFTELKDLLAVYDSVGIAGGLVHHSWAWEWSPARGNERLLEEIGGNDRLRPCFVALPHATGEQPPPEELAATVSELGGAVRIFPSMHQWRVSEWCAGKLFRALEEHRVPLLLHIKESDWDAIAGMLAAHPRMPVIVLGVYYRVDRYLYPLWEQHENLYVEANTYGVFHGIEAVCERFGPERFVFGTALPELEPGGPIARLTYAELPDADKRLIAGGNLKRLLAGGRE
jgi:predicted TIM-barrel fold metal-dependent hydrolase